MKLFLQYFILHLYKPSMQSHLGMFIVLLDFFDFSFFFLLADEKAKKPKLTAKYKDFFLIVGERFEGMFTNPVYNSDKMVILVKLFELSILAKYYCFIDQIKVVITYKDNLLIHWKHLGM